MFKNVMTYLGLGPDDEYDDGYLYDDEYDHGEAVLAPVPAQTSSHVTSVHSGPRPVPVDDFDDEPSAVGEVRPLRPVRAERPERATRTRPPIDRELIDVDAEDRRNAASRRVDANRTSDMQRGSDRSMSAERPSSSDRRGSVERTRTEPVVRPVPIQRTKPRALSPDSFGDAKHLADDIKADVPVVMNLRGVDRDLARRLIDFASGVCYSLDASMEKIASQVFLLTPHEVEVSGDERRRLEERGFDR